MVEPSGWNDPQETPGRMEEVPNLLEHNNFIKTLYRREMYHWFTNIFLVSVLGNNIWPPTCSLISMATWCLVKQVTRDHVQCGYKVGGKGWEWVGFMSSLMDWCIGLSWEAYSGYKRILYWICAWGSGNFFMVREGTRLSQCTELVTVQVTQF